MNEMSVTIARISQADSIELRRKGKALAISYKIAHRASQGRTYEVLIEGLALQDLLETLSEKGDSIES